MNPIPLPACGLHYGVPFEDYQKWPAANFSTIKTMRGTASKCKYAMDNPKAPTPAMILGSALHIATLEPARFENLFHICPPCDRRTKEGKEVYAKEEQKAGSKILIRQGSHDDEAMIGEVESIRGMAKAIHALKSAMPFIDGAGRNEVSMLWRDDETGLFCKARMDRNIELFEPLGIPVTVELKSTRIASAWGFSKEVDDRDYAAQAAGYCHGYKVITGKSPMHFFIAVENFAPFDCAVYSLDDQSLQTGHLAYRQMLNRYAECLKTNQWPGYPDKLMKLELPKWAHERDYGN